MATKEIKKPKLIMVCGAWGGGTTAVAELLDSLGLNTDGKCLTTTDAKTKNSFESLRFRQIIQEILSEETLNYIVDRKSAIALLEKYRDKIVKSEFYKKNPEQPFYLKYPLSSLLIAEIAQVFDVRFIYVVRKFKDIEQTRERRGWSKQLGLQGAKKIYGYMFNILINTNLPVFLIKYDELLRSPALFVRQLSLIAGIKLTEEEIAEKSKVIKRT